jgi:hypothetical protein
MSSLRLAALASLALLAQAQVYTVENNGSTITYTVFVLLTDARAFSRFDTPTQNARHRRGHPPGLQAL